MYLKYLNLFKNHFWWRALGVSTARHVCDFLKCQEHHLGCTSMKYELGMSLHEDWRPSLYI